jgi:hypothetical protein
VRIDKNQKEMFKEIWVWRNLQNMSDTNLIQKDRIKNKYFRIKQQLINLEEIHRALEKGITLFKINNMETNLKKLRKDKNF